ncbi:conserved hypothetical protein [Ricinus communis]|uniref:Uncharacterized protein n=1 Tax=Ricinus communis TaxID=3988 RepID=B9SHE2_RICCO|nr:conserved hypothetical protein [Ricinus communis]
MEKRSAGLFILMLIVLVLASLSVTRNTWCCLQRQEFANRRAINSMVRAGEITIVQRSAGLKVFPVAGVADFVANAFVPGAVKTLLPIRQRCRLLQDMEYDICSS